MRKARMRWVKLILIFGVLGAAIGLFLMLGPPQLIARTETPDFCASCHVMEAQFESWFHEGAHRSIKCVDCHLPHQNIAAYYTWKTIDGMKDMLIFHSGRVPERIVLSEHGQGVLQDNCIRCHETIVSRIDNERQCWGCHRRLSHVRSGAILTRDEL